ncbi:MAG: LacI family DNA-binding transcriptional regulator [Anaerolineaceae bacterium]|nr:LacI family DNA-binding transcriptional regulator [Anaerolineaceae bacterium]
MPVTLKDVAQKAGVSRSTVSRALNNTGRMTEETRNHIKTIAAEMGYVPNFLAQSLHETRTRTIGVVITSISNPFISELVEGIEEVADNSGYTIILGASKFDPEKEIKTILKFYQRRVDGIIVQAAHLTNFDDRRLESIDIPIVLINDEINIGTYNNVSTDSRVEVKKAVNYLFSIGHRHIGYIGSSLRMHSNRNRRMGYEDAHEENGQPINESHIFSLPMMSDYETGRKILDRVLDTNVTAVFCYCDMIAIGLMNACRERGVSVPDNLSVVGFDNIDQASQFYPPLTTVHQPKFELGRRAMRLIQHYPSEVVNEMLDCQLIVRESTRPLT